MRTRRATPRQAIEVNTRKIEETYHAFATRALCLAASLTLSSLALASNESPVGTWKTIDDETKQAKAVQNQRIRRRAHRQDQAVRQPGRAVRQIRRRAQRQTGGKA